MFGGPFGPVFRYPGAFLLPFYTLPRVSFHGAREAAGIDKPKGNQEHQQKHRPGDLGGFMDLAQPAELHNRFWKLLSRGVHAGQLLCDEVMTVR